MKAILQPWQLFLLVLARWVSRRHQDAIDYLLTENRILREKLGKKRILLNDDQRRRLAVKGKIVVLREGVAAREPCDVPKYIAI